MAELPPAARAEVVRRWSVSEPPSVAAAPVTARPGLKKCAAAVAPAASGLGAQLQAFARSIRNVG